MSGELQGTGGGAPIALCRCGAEAAGPCARCHTPVCGDCCVLTEGGARVWAICFACEGRGGRSLRGPWVRVVWWFVGPILILFALTVALAWLTR
jgi:hypothetical protein